MATCARRATGRDVPVAERSWPAWPSSSPAMVRSRVVLPQPDGPEQGEELAVLDRDRVRSSTPDTAGIHLGQDPTRSMLAISS